MAKQKMKDMNETVEKRISKIFQTKIGWFDIKAKDIIFVEILESWEAFGNIFDFIDKAKSLSINGIVDDLKSRNIGIDEEVKKIISSELFVENSDDAFYQIFDNLVIIKGRAALTRRPSVLIRDGFPDDFYLVPKKLTFHVAYILSYIFTKNFLNMHKMDRIFIMSEPFEGKYDHDKWIVKWDPSYSNAITTAFYDNPYSGDKNVGYLFFYP